MAIKLYGYDPSTCTRRVITVLEEKGLDYEFVSVDVFAGAHKTEEYTNKFHPFNKIPVLVDEDAGVRIYGMFQDTSQSIYNTHIFGRKSGHCALSRDQVSRSGH